MCAQCSRSRYFNHVRFVRPLETTERVTRLHEERRASVRVNSTISLDEATSRSVARVPVTVRNVATSQERRPRPTKDGGGRHCHHALSPFRALARDVVLNSGPWGPTADDAGRGLNAWRPTARRRREDRRDNADGPRGETYRRGADGRSVSQYGRGGPTRSDGNSETQQCRSTFGPSL